jgi:sugar lactone lactonase YvrE
VVTTLAGSTSGYTDGTGTAAKFYYPNGVAVDSAGNVYVADLINLRIRKVTPAGVVTTLAGSESGYADGTGTAAKFSGPYGVAVDSAGNVYVADRNNCRIRKVTPAGVVTTLAGSTSGYTDGTGTAARFWDPSGVVVDSAGNVYVADTANHRIRKVTPAGVVTTLAGGSESGYTNGTGTAAKFKSPRGVSIDGAGNVYVADTGNAQIRKITTGGVVTMFGTTLFTSLRSVAVDSAGNVYVAETGMHRIRKVTPAGVVTTLAGDGTAGYADGTGTAVKFNYPYGVAVDSVGNVYVADFYNFRIRKVTPAGVVTTLAGSSSGYADGTGTAAQFRGPSGVAVDSAGTLYVTDNNRIRKVTSAGVVTTLAGSTTGSSYVDGTGTAAQFCVPSGVAVDSAGNVYVADTNNHRIRKITPQP